MADKIAGKLALYSRGDRHVVFDPETMIWAARMLIGEGYKNGKGAAVLWTMMNRFLLQRHNFGSFLKLIRLYSQPINPRWIPGGDKYEAAKKAGDNVSTHPNRVERRKRIHATPWEKVPEEVKQIVGKMAIGRLPYPPKFGKQRMNHFASMPGVEKKGKDGVWFGGEYFYQGPGLLTGSISIDRDWGKPYIPGDENKQIPHKATEAPGEERHDGPCGACSRWDDCLRVREKASHVISVLQELISDLPK